MFTTDQGPAEERTYVDCPQTRSRVALSIVEAWPHDIYIEIHTDVSTCIGLAKKLI